ncbi:MULTISPECIES: ethanolamine utilization protein EutQ [Pseudomonas]|jgi:ethanolamine utilization protein EutQ|uniref:Ethanolamine utilization protein EutQ n=1 Tax=Pseudomonas kielensis TaxID=2762577 RepID=A0A7X1KZX1_9PSED|nr:MULTISPECIES: ethanolamine utilization protein EutQ [Pseudomonas]MBC2692306.1 ethanolamine utilization protein EutQ [Pseudomonas kielensis]NBB36046.1 ethanolamine utilization protein EutQ [Pseudomonas sp. BC115LW]
MSPRAPGKARVLCIDQQDLTFSVRGGPPGAAYVARALSNEVSPNIGVGFARWEGAQVQWTVLYDEVIFVIEGCLQLQADGEVFEVRPGQVLWIPEGSELVYGGHALFGYVVHPGNWKELHGLA